MPIGLLDTNVFLHAHTSDEHADDCRRFLAALERGAVQARLEPLVLHELSYALPHYLKQMTRGDIAKYLLMVLSWKGVRGDRASMADAVERWQRTPGLAFVDAFLAALAHERGCPIYSKNLRELRGQGVEAPQTLPYPLSEPAIRPRRK